MSSSEQSISNCVVTAFVPATALLTFRYVLSLRYGSGGTVHWSHKSLDLRRLTLNYVNLCSEDGGLVEIRRERVITSFLTLPRHAITIIHQTYHQGLSKSVYQPPHLRKDQLLFGMLSQQLLFEDQNFHLLLLHCILLHSSLFAQP